jgi:hypothetical protein
MIKTPIENCVGLKALAWDFDKRTFISPAQPEFIWSPGGLQACKCRLNSDPKHIPPEWNCTCGLYATFDVAIAEEYVNKSVISPIFLVEPSGTTILYTKGFRSAEMTIQMVALPPWSNATTKFACKQAADYFQISVVPLETLVITMDFINCWKLDFYKARSTELRYMKREKIVELARSKYEATKVSS